MTFHSTFKALAGLIAISVPLLAHHPFSSEFDGDKPVTLTGQVQDLMWSEPHLTFTLAVPTGNLSGDWTLEGASSITLKKRGFTESMLKNGDTVTVRAFRALNGAQTASARSVMLASGASFSLSDPQEDGGPAPVISGSVIPTSGDMTTFAQNDGPREIPGSATTTPMVILLGGFALIAAFLVRQAQAHDY
jgi:hypothetical protein